MLRYIQFSNRKRTLSLIALVLNFFSLSVLLFVSLYLSLFLSLSLSLSLHLSLPGFVSLVASRITHTRTMRRAFISSSSSDNDSDANSSDSSLSQSHTDSDSDSQSDSTSSLSSLSPAHIHTQPQTHHTHAYNTLLTSLVRGSRHNTVYKKRKLGQYAHTHAHVHTQPPSSHTNTQTQTALPIEKFIPGKLCTQNPFDTRNALTLSAVKEKSDALSTRKFSVITVPSFSGKVHSTCPSDIPEQSSFLCRFHVRSALIESWEAHTHTKTSTTIHTNTQHAHKPKACIRTCIRLS